MSVGLLFGQATDGDACVCTICCPTIEQQVEVTFSGIAACPGNTYAILSGGVLLTFGEGVWGGAFPDGYNGTLINFTCDGGSWQLTAVGIGFIFLTASSVPTQTNTASNIILACGDDVYPPPAATGGTVTWAIVS